MESQGHSKRLRKTHTATIFACLFAYGLVSAITGGTLNDLQEIYQMSASGISQIFVTRNVGNLIGSFICGSLYKHVNVKVSIILWLIAGGVGTAIVPDFAPYFWIAHVGQFVTGFSFGAIEVGFNVWLVQLWEEGVNPMMQSYHVSYGVGSLLAPLLTTPFLGPEKNETLNQTMEERFEIFEFDPEPPMNGTSHIAIPYGVFGGAYSLMGLVILFFLMIDRTPLRQPDTPEEDHAGYQSTNVFEWTVVGLLSAFIVTYCCFEAVMSNMLALYVTNNPDLNMDKKHGNYLLTFFWATYTTGRVVSIFVSYKLRPSTSLIIAQSIATAGAAVLLLLVFPATAAQATVWIATGIIGFGMGPLYPTAFTWTVRYIQLRYAHMSTALIAACVGGMLPTYIVAPWVENSTTALPGVMAGCAVLLVCILATMLFTTRNRSPIYAKEDQRSLIVND